MLRTLLVGVGGRGEWALRLAVPACGFRPVALCDVKADALDGARAATGLGESACFRDLGTALRSVEADCVILCAPTHLHRPLTEECVSAGLAVLVEKGMAPSWEEACALVRFVAGHDAKVAVAQNYRYQAAEQAIAAMVRGTDPAHPFGQPDLVIYAQPRVRPEPRHMTYPFASVWDMSCHHFDTLLSWLGPIESLTAQAWGARWSAYEHPNNTTAHLIFRNGTRVHYLHAQDAARASLRVEVHGEKGAAVLSDGVFTVNERPRKNFGENPETLVPLENDSGETGVLRDFHAWVTGRTEPGISARQNLETMAVCQMMVLSIEEGRTVRRDELPQPE